MQHQGERAHGTQPLRVGGELGERGCGALHEGAVDPARVGLGQTVEGMRQREDEVAVRHRQQLSQLRAAPSIAGAVLALWAVAVAAGVKQALLAAAMVTPLARAPACRGAARHDVAPDTGLRRAQRRAVHGLAQKGRAEGAKHLGQGGAQGAAPAQCRAGADVVVGVGVGVGVGKCDNKANAPSSALWPGRAMRKYRLVVLRWA